LFFVCSRRGFLIKGTVLSYFLFVFLPPRWGFSRLLRFRKLEYFSIYLYIFLCTIFHGLNRFVLYNYFIAIVLTLKIHQPFLLSLHVSPWARILDCVPHSRGTVPLWAWHGESGACRRTASTTTSPDGWTAHSSSSIIPEI